MEEFLSSNGVQYVHHDLATDHEAVEHLKGLGIKSVPVTIVDDEQVIIGYYPKKLVPALRLDINVDLSGKTTWMAEKYDIVLRAAMRAAHQASQEQLDEQVPWRPASLRDTIMHVLSFPELAFMSHETGSMSADDMEASNQRLRHLVAAGEISSYGDEVRRNIVEFLNNGDDAAFDRVVPAHYGGEVTVVELLNIILSHSTHHLKQVYHHLENNLGLTLDRPATESDLDGIVTPTALI